MDIQFLVKLNLIYFNLICLLNYLALRDGALYSFRACPSICLPLCTDCTGHRMSMLPRFGYPDSSNGGNGRRCHEWNPHQRSRTIGECT